MDEASLEHPESTPEHQLSLKERFERLPKFDLSGYRKQEKYLGNGATARIHLFTRNKEPCDVVAKEAKPAFEQYVMGEAKLLLSGEMPEWVVKGYGVVDSGNGLYSYSLIEEALIKKYGWSRLDSNTVMSTLSDKERLNVAQAVLNTLQKIRGSRFVNHYEVTFDSMFMRKKGDGIEIKITDLSPDIVQDKDIRKMYSTSAFYLLTGILGERLTPEDYVRLSIGVRNPREWNDHSKKGLENDAKEMVPAKFHGILETFVGSGDNRIGTTIKKIEEMIRDTPSGYQNERDISRPPKIIETASTHPPEATTGTTSELEYIDLGPAADLLGIRPSKLFELAWEKKLIPFTQFTSGRMLFKPSDIEDFNKKSKK